MEKFDNWNDVEAKGMEDFKYLPMGAYECVIKSAEEYTSESTGNKSLKGTVDIAKGDFKDFFTKQFDNMTGDKKWSNNATRYLGLGENSKGFFKGFVTTIENSNKGFAWDWDESKLVGKKAAATFEPEEYDKNDGTKGVAIKLNKFRSLDKLNDIKVGNIKLTDGSYVDYEDYKKNGTKNNIADDVVTFDGDNDLPF